MSSNNSTSTTDDVVLSGELIFVIVFFATGLFFLVIMSVVCFGEYRQYRNRNRRPDNVFGGDYPKQLPPVANENNTNGNNLQQSSSGAGNSGQNAQQTDIVGLSVGSSSQSGAQKGENQSLPPTPSKKRKHLPPLPLETSTGKITNPEDIFSPRTNLPPHTTVAFVEAPLPSISSKVKEDDLTPVISISS